MKVLLVDDHPLILSALQAIIQTLDEQIDVLTADKPADAFAVLAADPQVELVLLDLSLGDTVDGFAVLADLRHRYPGLPVVVVSATEKLTDMVRAVDMGAMGFVPKRSTNRELYEALALVRLPGMKLADAAAAADAAAGRVAAPAPAAQPGWPTPAPGPDAQAADTAPAVMRLMPDDPAGRDGMASTRLLGAGSLGLTPRQTDVLALLLKGLPNKLIARELNVSVDTVKDHVAAVLRALGVTSRTQAVLVVSRMTQQGGAPGPF